MSTLILLLGLLALFLGLAIFFSAAETAFTAVSRLRLKFQAQAGDGKARAILTLVSNPDRFLGVILLGSTVSNIAAASIVTYLATAYTPRGRIEFFGTIASIALTLVVLIFCELTPKIVAATHADQASRGLYWPIRVVIWVLSPIARVAVWISGGIVRLTGVSTVASPFTHALSEEEIRAMISASEENDMPKAKKEMLYNVFEIGDTQVRSVMIPRGSVTAVEINDPIPEILGVIAQTSYSRIPVYRENFDNPIGILNAKDLLPYLDRPKDINLPALLRPIHFVPDTARLDLVLKQLQSMHQHIAIVVDEFGGVEGIVTLEDLLEEIVGEIRDEHDMEVENVRELSPNLYSIAGNLPVKDFNRAFKEQIPEADEYMTVVGFLEALTGRLLQEGESVRYQKLTFSIEKMEAFRVASVRVRVPPSTEDKKPGA